MALASASAQITSSGISPSTLYYLALYALVIIVRFFKLAKDENKGGWKTHTKKEVFHVGLEIVYTASGLVVLLLNDLHDYAAFIILGYVILVMVSSHIESMDQKFSDRAVFLTHLTILIVVSYITVWYFQVVQPGLMVEKSKAESTKIHHYRVAVPYQDLALRDHLGSYFGNRQLVYVTEMEASDENDAKEKGLGDFRNKVTPFESKRHIPSPNDLITSSDQVMVKMLD